ncbi:MAG: hypothetical protein NT049_12290 [Planctomycetota bacterium]|nr:hypothetical protein [Planctomycetota bacterium]
MDGKTVVIGVLVVSAVLLSGIVVSGVRQEAYAQGGSYATYLAVTANVQEQFVNFVVLDTEARRMLFYKIEQGKWQLEPASGADLKKDFAHKAP